VPYDSAVMHLPGARETKLGIDADHSNMCRFDLSGDGTDSDNYELVQGNLNRLCWEATKDKQAVFGNQGTAGTTERVGYIELNDSIVPGNNNRRQTFLNLD
jgi:hypothetical protein